MTCIGGHEVHPAADAFPLITGNDFKELVASVRKLGLLHPVERTSDGLVIDGRNRLKACIEADVEPTFVTKDPDDVYEYVWSVNKDRRHLDPGQRAACRLCLDELRDAETKRSQSANAKRSVAMVGNDNRTGDGSHQTRATLPATVRGEDSARSRTELASKAEVSPRTMQKAITLKKEAPALFDRVREGDQTLNAAYREHTRHKAIAAISAEPRPLPAGPFRVIVADPPWRYEKRKDDGTHRTALSYPDMSTEEICALDVGSRAHDDCVLWLWTTNAFMRDAFRVLDAWGFHEKTILTWAKNKMGTGDWLRGKTEHCVMAVRGKPVVSLTNQTTLLDGPVREHSRKPDEFYALVEALCPGSKLEVFGRESREGWAVWGAESEQFDAAE